MVPAPHGKASDADGGVGADDEAAADGEAADGDAPAGDAPDSGGAPGDDEAADDAGSESRSDGVAFDPQRYFPKPEPYENQAAAMDRIAVALDDGRDVLFEGACGTGKTLAALAPALAFARETDKTVVITTNVNQQARQFVREAREIQSAADPPIRAVVFRGKRSMCHLDVGYEECRVLRDNTREEAERERDREELAERADELLDEAQAGDDDAAAARSSVVEEMDRLDEEADEAEDANTCSYYRGTLAAGEEFYGWLYDGVRDPDEILAYGEQHEVCGYELLKEGMEGVDLVICNYNHLLDPAIRPSFFRWLGRDPEDVVAVFDEAHNLESAAREHGTRRVAESTLDAAVEELDDCGDGRATDARNAVAAFRDALVEVCEGAVGLDGGGDVGEEWTDVPVRNDEGRDDLTRAFLRRYTGQGVETDLETAAALGRDLDEEYEAAYRRGETDAREECPTLTAARFVEHYLSLGDATDRYPVAGVRQVGDGLRGRAELYTCIPRPVTEELFEELYASVLMSATLRPFDVLADSLGIDDPETMAYGLTFPQERRRTVAASTPPLFASRRDDPDVQTAVGDALADAVRFTAGNTLCFFPSYGEARRYHDLVGDDLAATTYLDEPGTSAEGLREEFVDDDVAALFTSLWGTLTEGVSFDGDDASTVAVVGVPYPRIDDRVEAVQEAYAEAFGDRADRDDPGWAYAVEAPTVRKTRQALGRVIRSPEEVGARVLLDRRYCAGARGDLGKYSVHDTFPPAEREELVDVTPGRLRYALLNFYTEHDAYDGTPPEP